MTQPTSLIDAAGAMPLQRRQLLAGFGGALLLPSVAIGAAAGAPIVESSDGKLAGVRSGRSLAFRGIPYAAPTGSRNRFMAPQPVERWAGVRQATEVGNRCPQIAAIEFNIRSPGNWFGWYADTSPTGEDCCRLNVFTPGLGSHARRPVMVYLHGGGFRTGGGSSPSLNGTPLAEYGDVVVVTLNHRLNVFGYVNLGHADPAFADAANAGQLDIVAALRWVHENIAAFGGDPNNVLIFGQSGGGSKIVALMAMPAAKGLFHKAINMSGSSGYGIGPAEERAALTEEYLRQLGVGPHNVRALQDMPPERLLDAHRKAAAQLHTDDFRPSVDGRHIPYPLLSPEGLAVHADVPLMMGSTRTEATAWLGGDPRNLAATMADVTARVARQFEVGEAESGAIVAAYRDEDPRRSPYDILVAIASDTVMRVRMLVGAEPKIAAKRAPVHVYSFEWNVPADGGVWGSPHTCDIPFAFRTIDTARGMTLGGPAPQRVSDHYAAAFVAFARTSDPHARGETPWPRYDLAKRTTMLVNAECRTADDYHATTRRVATPLVAQPGYRITTGPLMRPVA